MSNSISMHEEEPLVSIVVPVHNAVRTIERCVSSLLHQSYKRIEIILVENGSKDGSGALCSALFGNNASVICLHSDIADVTQARNIGIETASGSYIAFCDADDWYRLDAIEMMVKKSIEHHAPIVKAGYEKHTGIAFAPRICRKFSKVDKVCERSDWTYADYARFYNPIRYPYCSSVWSSLYSKECLIGIPKHIRVSGLRRGEDGLINAFAFQSAQRILLIPNSLYCYRVGGVTATNERLVDDLFSYERILDAEFSPYVPFDQKLLVAEFACYLLTILLKRYQNCIDLNAGELKGFYSDCMADIRVRNAARVIEDDRMVADAEIKKAASFFLSGDVESLYELARKTYWSQRAIMKAALLLSGLKR